MNLPQLKKSDGSSASSASCQTPVSPELCDAFDVVKAGAQPDASSKSRRMIVCHQDELPAGSNRIVTDGKWSAGVYNIAGKLHAIRNVCPHAGAPLCKGTVHGTHAPTDVGEFDPVYVGRILRCPWHGWEFDIITGKALYDRKSRVATYPVIVDEKGMIVVLR